MRDLFIKKVADAVAAYKTVTGLTPDILVVPKGMLDTAGFHDTHLLLMGMRIIEDHNLTNMELRFICEKGKGVV